MESERVRVVRDLQRSEDGELGGNPDRTDAQASWDLGCDVLRARAMLGDGRDYTEAQNTKSPANPVLDTVLPANSLHSASKSDRGQRNSQRQGEDVHARANGGSVTDCLEVDREVNCFCQRDE